MLRASDLYPQLNVITSFSLGINKEVYEMFFEVLADYCVRFNVTVKPVPRDIIIHGVWMSNEEAMSSEGVTVYNEDDPASLIYVQATDFTIDNTIEIPEALMKRFVETICHEFVHVSQELTGRKGFRHRIKHNKKNEDEKYYFNPYEVEARILECFYQSAYGNKVIKKWQKYLTSKQAASGRK